MDEFEKASLMRGDVPDSPRNKPFWRRHLLPAAIHFFIFIVYITVGILALDSRAKSAVGGRSLLWCKCRIELVLRCLVCRTDCGENIAPANEIIKYELQTFNSGDGHEGPYSGYPRPDLEKAWTGLLGRGF